MARRQASRVQEDTIPEELLANIPVLGGGAQEATTFAIEHEEVIFAPPPSTPSEAPPSLPDAATDAPAAPALSTGAAIAAQLRYDLGEAFARELDRAEQAVAGAMAEMEARLAQAESEVASLRAEVERERAAREGAEARLKAFKDLALR